MDNNYNIYYSSDIAFHYQVTDFNFDAYKGTTIIAGCMVKTKETVQGTAQINNDIQTANILKQVHLSNR